MTSVICPIILNHNCSLKLSYFEHFISLLKKLSLAFLIFTLCRIAFYIVNIHHFDNVSFSLFFYGLRFDAVSIAYLFSPLILLQLLPFSFRNTKSYSKMMSFFFYLGISLGVVFNLIDVAYFQFSFKRTTADFFSMIGAGGGGDFFKLLPNYIIDYLYDYFILAFLIVFAYQIHKRIIKYKIPQTTYKVRDYGIHTTIFIVFFRANSYWYERGISV